MFQQVQRSLFNNVAKTCPTIVKRCEAAVAKLSGESDPCPELRETIQCVIRCAVSSVCLVCGGYHHFVCVGSDTPDRQIALFNQIVNEQNREVKMSLYSSTSTSERGACVRLPLCIATLC